MKYLSVCSGIEAATTAWHELGWTPSAFSEIEKFPSAVLEHHYPKVPNVGDMTKYKEWDIGTIDLLVGGTPCQSFSVAGLRKGLDDPRGNLALVYCGILDRFKPKWFIWENVPGVLSSSGGRDFGSFLGAISELGYGYAYRILDAQYFGVAQRRRRVFVVGHLGDWRPAASVLFESESLSRDSKPSRTQREGTSSITTNRLVAFGEYSEDGTASTLKARDYKDATDLIASAVYEYHPADSRVKEMGEVCQTMTSRWGTGGGNVPLVQQAYSIREDAKANNFSATPLEVSTALKALQPSPQSHHAQTFVAHAFKVRGGSPTDTGEQGGVVGRVAGKGYLGQDEVTYTIGTSQDQYLFNNLAVRRLTPTECERLQGFPDGYTNIPWRKKECPPDSARYKALGNSMAVPVMKWLGERINEVNKLKGIA
jgi:DNA (cytosine-5)-methyltransferase 1